MYANAPLNSLTRQGQALDGLDQRKLMYSTLLIVVISVIVAFNWSKTCSEEVPIINPGKRFSLSNYDAKRAFLTHSKTLLASARALYPKQPYRMITDLGEVLMIPPEFCDEIRNHPDLSPTRAVFEDFHGDIPGFDFTDGSDDAGGQLVQHVARKQMTQSLERSNVLTDKKIQLSATMTEPLAEEATSALTINIGVSEDWQEITIKPRLLDIVARLSSRVFLGKELCRNEDWLRITKEYAVNVFIAAMNLRLYPRFSRKVVHWFLPKCRNLRAQFAEAQRVITTLLEERRRTKQANRAAGLAVPLYNDAVDWFEHEAEIRGMTYNPAKMQLGLSLAAIHTTSDLLEQVMLDLAQHPEIISPLRKEIAQSLRDGGWKQTSLCNMKLLDSVMKESQRMKPITIATMRRWVESDVTLSNGYHLEKGTRIQVDSCRMWDPDLHKDPDQWDGYRFLKLRAIEATKHSAQLVSTSANHLGFGHGQHACPGRFFAAHEIKIALCHLLIKYDWKLAPGTHIAPIVNGFSTLASPRAKILVRRRAQMEIDIDSI